MNHSAVRSAARATLKGFWLRAIVAFAAIQAVAAVISLTTEVVLAVSGANPSPTLTYTVMLTGSAVSALLTAPLNLGFKRILWQRSVGDTPSLGMLFELFGSGKQLFKYYALALVRGLIILCPTVLTAVPYVVLSILMDYGFSFTGMLAGELGELIMMIAGLLMTGGVAASVVLWLKLFVSDFVLLSEGMTGVIDNLRMTARVTDGNMGHIFVFMLGFFPWFLLRVTGFGRLFVDPYYTTASAIFSRMLIGRYKADLMAAQSGTAEYQTPAPEQE